MQTTPGIAITALLRDAEAAHGAYETNELGGVFDKAWPRWYAAYLLDHGLADHLPSAGPIDVDTLAATLQRLAADYEREKPESPWPDVYAQGLVVELG